MQSLIVWAWILSVVVIAFAVIYFNRKKMRTPPLKREPHWMNTPQNLKQEPFEEEEFYDPVVSGQQNSSASYEEKSGQVQRYVAEKNERPPLKQTQAPISLNIISLMIMAKEEKPYAGYELLQALLSSGLRYGKMSIFHRYQQMPLNNSENNQILFSLASAVKPGTFEMPKMGSFSTPGLILFMQTAEQKDLLETFELMLETARQLVDDLGGEIWDAQRQLLNEGNIQDIRCRLTEYERARATTDMFNA